MPKKSDEILRKLTLKSSEGGYKITIIWLPEKRIRYAKRTNCWNSWKSHRHRLFFFSFPKRRTWFSQHTESHQRITVLKIYEASIDRNARKIRNPENSSHSIAHLANGNFYQSTRVNSSERRERVVFQLVRKFDASVLPTGNQRKQLWSEQVAGMGRERQKVF